MQKIWHRKFDGWWYVTLTEGGTRHQIKLVKAPNDKESRAIAETHAIQELAARDHVAPPAGDPTAPAWATVEHVVRAFLKHSREEHIPETFQWYTYRSSFATDALESGVPDASVADLLGHTNTQTLHRFYNRLSGRVEHLQDAAARATRPAQETGGAPGEATP